MNRETREATKTPTFKVFQESRLEGIYLSKCPVTELKAFITHFIQHEVFSCADIQTLKDIGVANPSHINIANLKGLLAVMDRERLKKINSSVVELVAAEITSAMAKAGSAFTPKGLGEWCDTIKFLGELSNYVYKSA